MSDFPLITGVSDNAGPCGGPPLQWGGHPPHSLSACQAAGAGGSLPCGQGVPTTYTHVPSLRSGFLLQSIPAEPQSAFLHFEINFSRFYRLFGTPHYPHHI